MKNPLAYASAGIAFGRVLFGRRDSVVQVDSLGLTKLADWKHVPEAVALETAARRPSLGEPRCLLYCFEGPHAGEQFTVRSPRTRVGCRATDDLVLTPARDCAPASFEFKIEEKMELLAVAPNAFVLNGRAEYRASLVDYDELVLLGNHFLVLELSGGRT